MCVHVSSQARRIARSMSSGAKARTLEQGLDWTVREGEGEKGMPQTASFDPATNGGELWLRLRTWVRHSRTFGF
ncbi:hypothetical protein BHE90_014650 [Fusarium euwallaceae]|uniref:Uncharacterized protein n=5 Tax=Fusarium solani species complex TaxID=232080 RepID=A0A3M2RN32_9HYPO|nr:hypothetical protein CDV36_013791 [Fusarium kuroshium]RSL71706.1 hypothetical protein CEP51_012001 [Fusarium floridanum]RSL95148.1 hypothetical protein CEP52_012236 [Fusarium oligoseptatum]RSM20441.1 hypothetical protein CDV31_000665 [Fusarium ambrosium]RTE70945.1 hypothetical protein BHE90_014650 [Fusarium euwallaceae]